jgi:hypothetical protein
MTNRELCDALVARLEAPERRIDLHSGLPPNRFPPTSAAVAARNQCSPE